MRHFLCMSTSTMSRLSPLLFALAGKRECARGVVGADAREARQGELARVNGLKHEGKEGAHGLEGPRRRAFLRGKMGRVVGCHHGVRRQSFSKASSSPSCREAVIHLAQEAKVDKVVNAQVQVRGFISYVALGCCGTCPPPCLCQVDMLCGACLRAWQA